MKTKQTILNREEVLGLWKQRSSRKLLSAEEIKDLIKHEKKAYLNWLSTKQQGDKEVYKENRTATIQAVIAAERNLCDKKCQQINTHIGGRKYTETYRSL